MVWLVFWSFLWTGCCLVDAVRIGAYNINYNGQGGEGDVEKQNGYVGLVELFARVDADVLLLSEVEKGCGTGDGSQVLGNFTDMDHVFVEEFTSKSNTSCSTGNAILSRFPLANVERWTFQSTCCHYSSRTGERSSIAATITTGNNELICLHSTHLESGTSEELVKSVFVRADQAKELSEFAKEYHYRHGCKTSVIGGDMNAPFKQYDPTIYTFEKHGFADIHQHLEPHLRSTLEGNQDDDSFQHKFGLSTLDYMLVFPESDAILEQSHVCHDPDICHGWSDHTLIWGAIKTNGSVLEEDQALLQLAVKHVEYDFVVNWVWVSIFLWPFLICHFFKDRNHLRQWVNLGGRRGDQTKIKAIQIIVLVLLLMGFVTIAVIDEEPFYARYENWVFLILLCNMGLVVKFQAFSVALYDVVLVSGFATVIYLATMGLQSSIVQFALVLVLFLGNMVHFIVSRRTRVSSFPSNLLFALFGSITHLSNYDRTWKFTATNSLTFIISWAILLLTQSTFSLLITKLTQALSPSNSVQQQGFNKEQLTPSSSP